MSSTPRPSTTGNTTSASIRRGEWAEDAHANLQRIKQRMAEREKRTAIPLLSPKEFSAASRRIMMTQSRCSISAPSVTWRQLPNLGCPLPNGASDSDQVTPAEASRALEHLAEILQSRHDDNWLSDFLQSPPSPTEKEAVHGSVASDEALQRRTLRPGRGTRPKIHAGFPAFKESAGMLRASFALMMAQSFGSSIAAIVIRRPLAQFYSYPTLAIAGCKAKP